LSFAPPRFIAQTPKLNEVEPNAYNIPRQVARQLAATWDEEVHSTSLTSRFIKFFMHPLLQSCTNISSFPPLVAAERLLVRKQLSGLHSGNLHNLWLSSDSDVGGYFHVFSVSEKFLAALPPAFGKGPGRGCKTA
jgi:hypothetical protein